MAGRREDGATSLVAAPPRREAGVEARADAALGRVRLAVLLMLRDPEASALTLGAIAVLLLVSEGRLQPAVREVAEHLRISQSAALKAIYALETRALVTRCRHPADGRIALIAMTGKGEALVRRAEAAAAATGSSMGQAGHMPLAPVSRAS